jgi:hypothetical protein
MVRILVCIINELREAILGVWKRRRVVRIK